MSDKVPKEIRDIQKIRNIGIMAHIDAGKTTLTERMLYITGKIYKIGEVHDGTATMDFLDQERERGITITSAVTTFYWKNCDIHLIDTPGHVDFTIEVERSLRVLDGAIAVFDGVNGVEPQSETVWFQADKFGVPRIAFINKLDRIGADFEFSLNSLEKHFTQKMIPIQYPIGIESDFKGIVDLIEMRALIWDGTDPKEFKILDKIPEELVPKVQKFREIMLERLSEVDDEICFLFLDGAEIKPDLIKEKIRKHTLKNIVVPVLCGSALRNKAIPPVLDAVVDFLPSPYDIGYIVGNNPKTGEIEKRNLVTSEKLCALAFKVMLDEDGRKLTFLRIYSGKLEEGQDVYNATLGIKEKISRIFLMHADHKKRIEFITSGNIIATMGLKRTSTGDTISDENYPIVLEPIKGYKTVIKMAIEPNFTHDKEKLDDVLKKIKDEDPTFDFYEDKNTGETIIEGMGELHLEVIATRIERNFGIPIRIGKPQVVYQESITSKGVGEGTIDRKVDEERLYCFVKLEVEPTDRGKGIEFEFKVQKDTLKDEVISIFKESVLDASKNGPLAGYPVTDFKVNLIDINYIVTNFNPVSIKIATSIALNEALKNANGILLEPFMEVEIDIPPEFLGEVIGNFQARKGRVENIEEKQKRTIIKGVVPLSRMFGYSTELRSLTQGRGTFSMQFLKYDIKV